MISGAKNFEEPGLLVCYDQVTTEEQLQFSVHLTSDSLETKNNH